MVGPKIQYILALNYLQHFHSFLSSIMAAVLQNIEVLQNLNLHMQSPEQLLAKKLRTITTQTSETFFLYSSFLSGTLPCKFQLPFHPLGFNFCLLDAIRLIFFIWAPSFCATFRKLLLDIKSGRMLCSPHIFSVSLGLQSCTAYFSMPKYNHLTYFVQVIVEG